MSYINLVILLIYQISHGKFMILIQMNVFLSYALVTGNLALVCTC